MTYFRELNWIFPVKEKSIFKITVSSRDKEIGSTRVDLNNLKSIPFDQFGNREVGVSLFGSHVVFDHRAHFSSFDTVLLRWCCHLGTTRVARPARCG